MKCWQTKEQCRTENEEVVDDFILHKHSTLYSLGYMSSLVARLMCEIPEEMRQDIISELKK